MRKQFNWLIVACIILLATVAIATGQRQLTNEDLIRMVKGGLSEDSIVLVIQNCPSKYDTSPSALIALKEAGATQKILDAFLRHQVSSTRVPSFDDLAVQSTMTSTKLKLGNYKIRATQSVDSYSGTIKESFTIKLKIENIDTDGKVEARLSMGIEEGQLKGSINERGILELDGFLTSQLIEKARFKLKAEVQTNKLINGTYLIERTSRQTSGVFALGTWEGDL